MQSNIIRILCCILLQFSGVMLSSDHIDSDNDACEVFAHDHMAEMLGCQVVRGEAGAGGAARSVPQINNEQAPKLSSEELAANLADFKNFARSSIIHEEQVQQNGPHAPEELRNLFAYISKTRAAETEERLKNGQRPLPELQGDLFLVAVEMGRRKDKKLYTAIDLDLTNEKQNEKQINRLFAMPASHESLSLAKRLQNKGLVDCRVEGSEVMLCKKKPYKTINAIERCYDRLNFLREEIMPYSGNRDRNESMKVFTQLLGWFDTRDPELWGRLYDGDQKAYKKIFSEADSILPQNFGKEIFALREQRRQELQQAEQVRLREIEENKARRAEKKRLAAEQRQREAEQRAAEELQAQAALEALQAPNREYIARVTQSRAARINLPEVSEPGGAAQWSEDQKANIANEMSDPGVKKEDDDRAKLVRMHKQVANRVARIVRRKERKEQAAESQRLRDEAFQANQQYSVCVAQRKKEREDAERAEEFAEQQERHKNGQLVKSVFDRWVQKFQARRAGQGALATAVIDDESIKSSAQGAKAVATDSLISDRCFERKAGTVGFVDEHEIKAATVSEGIESDHDSYAECVVSHSVPFINFPSLTRDEWEQRAITCDCKDCRWLQRIKYSAQIGNQRSLKIFDGLAAKQLNVTHTDFTSDNPEAQKYQKRIKHQQEAGYYAEHSATRIMSADRQGIDLSRQQQ